MHQGAEPSGVQEAARTILAGITGNPLMIHGWTVSDFPN